MASSDKSQTNLSKNPTVSGGLLHREATGSTQGPIFRMVRFFVSLMLIAFSVAESQAQLVSSSPTSSAAPQASPSVSTSPSRFELLRKAFDQLSPEQQEKVLLNLLRWQELSQDEREVLRQRERVQRQKQEASINEAYQKSGLQLNDEQRVLFRKRYLQE